MLKSIIAKGIRVHNLKNIDINIPLNKLTVITGVSGSGKSSLAFDTLYAEGQRRYVESFSAYARQFLERIDKPDVDHIEGIPAAIAMEQKNPVKNRRSTVGTATEVNDYLRLLFAKIGKLYCKKCSNPVKKDSVSDIVTRVAGLENGTKILIVFPIPTNQDIDNGTHLKGLKEKGIIRILADQTIIDISRQSTTGNTLNIKKVKSIFGVIDRITIKENIQDRLTDAVETAYSLGLGRAGIAFVGRGTEPNDNSPCWNVKWQYSSNFMCSECDIEYPDPEPQLFSFNNPIGACEVCQGFGHTIEIDMDLVIPDKKKSIKEGAIATWRTPKSLSFKRELVRAAPKYKIPVNVPFNKLSKEHVKLIWEGTDDFCGINEFFKKLEAKQYKMHIRVLLSKYRTYKTCHSCNGTRLKKSALNVKINSLNIAEVCAMNIEKASEFFKTLKLNKYEKKVSNLILKEIAKRLEYMVHVGLGYLALDRLTRSLSGGESQRVNLTTSLGSSLVNTLYILDEPSIGLHARDTDRLIWTLTKLRDIGNTVIVVEHDKSIINASDYVIDIGPAAGEKGGTVVFQGTIKDISSNTGKRKKFDESLTVQYLLGKKKINVPDKRRRPTKKEICIKGASQNNLKSIDVSFPLNLFICVTGVSGSGKSTLIHDTLYGAIKTEINGHSVSTGKYKSISGAKQIN
ncbi:MAG: excinuclease ABC subunit UvrA, partial [Candidatus Anammoxibacter sp.]